MLFLIIALTDVIVKVTVADFIATFLADVIAINVWDGVTTHYFNYLVDVIASYFIVVDVKNHLLDQYI